jgi:hypothetical protein
VSPLHNFVNDHRGLVDLAAAAFAGVAAVSFLQALATVITILAGLGSLSLVGMRWYDRYKYGHGGKAE